MANDRDALQLAERIVSLAAELGVRIAVAESLTGGLVAAALVSVPGASAVVNGGIVAYDTDLKASLLGVDRGLLEERGPVDSDVAQQMAQGVRDACGVQGVGPAQLGVSTTGVAGPDPDPQTGQPGGTVWIGASSKFGTRSQLLEGVGGSRQEVRETAVYGALAALYEELVMLGSGKV